MATTTPASLVNKRLSWNRIKFRMRPNPNRRRHRPPRFSRLRRPPRLPISLPRLPPRLPFSHPPNRRLFHLPRVLPILPPLRAIRPFPRLPKVHPRFRRRQPRSRRLSRLRPLRRSIFHPLLLFREVEPLPRHHLSRPPKRPPVRPVSPRPAIPALHPSIHPVKCLRSVPPRRRDLSLVSPPRSRPALRTGAQKHPSLPNRSGLTPTPRPSLRLHFSPRGVRSRNFKHPSRRVPRHRPSVPHRLHLSDLRRRPRLSGSLRHLHSGNQQARHSAPDSLPQVFNHRRRHPVRLFNLPPLLPNELFR